METATTAPTSAPTNELSNLKLNCRNKANFTTVNFAVEIPSEMMSLPGLNLQSNGVVGTITFLNNSIMVWIGWGKLEASTEDAAAAKATGMPVMGPTTVAMPRTAYRGLSSGDESPCSQLIGGTNEEEVMMGNSMASRLAKKIGLPVFVSCSLSEVGNLRSFGGANGGEEGLLGNAFGDVGSLAVHAAALAEKEVGRISLERRDMKKE
jgi:hypothetical protein